MEYLDGGIPEGGLLKKLKITAIMILSLLVGIGIGGYPILICSEIHWVYGAYLNLGIFIIAVLWVVTFFATKIPKSEQKLMIGTSIGMAILGALGLDGVWFLL
jgi:hypothetical protein